MMSSGKRKDKLAPFAGPWWPQKHIHGLQNFYFPMPISWSHDLCWDFKVLLLGVYRQDVGIKTSLTENVIGVCQPLRKSRTEASPLANEKGFHFHISIVG